MIVLHNLSKYYDGVSGRVVVADQINAVFPTGQSVALLGQNGAGKSSLLKMIAGASRPNAGQILTDGRISYPVGLASAMHPDLTGSQNVKFVARIYGADTRSVSEFVAEFSELGRQLFQPVRQYSSGMKARLAFGINMALDFDTYLIDEVTGAGDKSFVEKSRAVFAARMAGASAIFVSHSMPMLRRMCSAGAVLHQGQLSYYDDLEEAIDRHETLLKERRRS